MLHISKPVEWEVYNIPPVRPVRYYSILKRKREVAQQKHDTQVCKHGYLHYCGIVPKNISSSLNSKHELIIVFFNQTPNTSFIGFRVKVNKETLTEESNSLLLFLKKSKKASFFFVNNNYIHVQCGTNAWELFYCLYADYLKKYVLTFIGTQFFNHFVYSHCIQKEIQLIDMLYKGSKVIKISKKSIYYEIHRKRKISVTDLIHMTLNMPSRKRFVISCFSSKEALLHSRVNDESFCTPVGTTINVSKLMLKRLKKHSQNILSDETDKSYHFQRMFASSNSAVSVSSKLKPSITKSSSSATMKRKFCELGFDKDIKPGPSTSKFIRSSLQASVIEQYQNLKPFTVKSYSSIPCLSNLVPSLLKNGKSSHFVHDTSYLFSSTCNISLLPSTPSNKEGTSKVMDHINSGSLTINGSENEAHHVLNQSNNKETLKSIHQNNSFSESQRHKNSEFYTYHKTSDQVSSFSIFPKLDEKLNSSMKDAGFSTAAGKAINISNSAMQAAHKLIQGFSDENQQNLKEVDNHNLNEIHRTTNLNNPNYRKKLTIDSQTTNQGTSKIFDFLEDVSFSTAAGKSITISNTALQVANKIIQDDHDKEMIPTSSKTICFDAPKNKMYKHKSAIFKDCSSKASVDANIVGIDMDNALVEKFFEEAIFDEELETSKCQKNENLNLPSKSDQNIPSQKQRKSLGGRRNMKYSSKKL